MRKRGRENIERGVEKERGIESLQGRRREGKKEKQTERERHRYK